MHRELEERRDYLCSHHITSIYFGGGTPSLVQPAEIERLITHARELFDCSAVGEITLEANPDDLTEEYVKELATTSINRVSLGIQSFDDEALKMMNRRHTAAEAVEAVHRLKRYGIGNISVDIIFGIAGYGGDVLRNTLKEAIKLDVGHISAYHLTIEERTKLGLMTQRGEYTPMEREEYIETVCDALELLPPDTVIGRLTGDGMADSLLAPLWSMKKVTVINDIDKTLYARGSCQGMRYKGEDYESTISNTCGTV
jgi:radical SAM protein (TIGR01212 family)